MTQSARRRVVLGRPHADRNRYVRTPLYEHPDQSRYARAFDPHTAQIHLSGHLRQHPPDRPRTLDGPARQRLRDGVLPSQQAPLAGACDTGRPGAEPHSPGASGIWER
jgi:hypothetical protein